MGGHQLVLESISLVSTRAYKQQCLQQWSMHNTCESISSAVTTLKDC
jgi:hypothetical protein